MTNIVLLIGIEHVTFDYKDIKKLVYSIFENQEVSILADDFEEESFEVDQEDILIEVDAFKYDDKFNGDFYSVSLSIENLSTDKNIELQMSEKGKLTPKSLFELLDKLIILAKFSITKNIF